MRGVCACLSACVRDGIVKWKCVARGAGQCGMASSDGTAWNVVWFGIMSEMVFDVE